MMKHKNPNKKKTHVLCVLYKKDKKQKGVYLASKREDIKDTNYTN